MDEAFLKLFPRSMANREQLIKGIEEDLNKTLDANCTTVQERTAEDRQKEVEAVKKEAEEKAKEMHRIRLQRETALMNRISQLERELQVRFSSCRVGFPHIAVFFQTEKEMCSEVVGINRTMTNMLIFPHHVSKSEVMMWVSGFE